MNDPPWMSDVPAFFELLALCGVGCFNVCLCKGYNVCVDL